MVQEAQRRKAFLVGENTCTELQRLVHPSQMLAQYGGEAPEPTAWWPPTMPPNPSITDNAVDEIILSESHAGPKEEADPNFENELLQPLSLPLQSYEHEVQEKGNSMQSL